jgi:hypothetical protein|nr:MAG TPA: Gifsy-2 prophage ATP-binding sugar transporter-like barrel, 4 helix bundle.7A [Caudoviricetes sp.]
MSAFKDIVKKDIDDIFLDFDIFGEIHTIDEKEIVVIVDNNELLKREVGRDKANYIDGIYHKQILFYVKSDDLGALPRIGRIMSFDNEDMRVVDAVNETGVYSITLEANRH